MVSWAVARLTESVASWAVARLTESVDSLYLEFQRMSLYPSLDLHTVCYLAMYRAICVDHVSIHCSMAPTPRPGQMPPWVVWGGCGEREAQGTGSDFRHAPNLTVRAYPKSKSMRRKEIKRRKETDSDSGRDSNPRPSKWPAML